MRIKKVLIISILLISVNLNAKDKVYLNLGVETGKLNIKKANNIESKTSTSSASIGMGIIINNILLGAKGRLINSKCVECSDKNIGTGYSLDLKLGISQEDQIVAVYAIGSAIDYDFLNNDNTINNDTGYGVGLGASLKLGDIKYSGIPNMIYIDYIKYNMDSSTNKYKMSSFTVGTSWSF